MPLVFEELGRGFKHTLLFETQGLQGFYIVFGCKCCSDVLTDESRSLKCYPRAIVIAPGVVVVVWRGVGLNRAPKVTFYQTFD